MASGPGKDVEMQNYSSSPGSLSSPPSAISEPGSPTRLLNAGRANMEMDEIVVDPGSTGPRFGVMQLGPKPPPSDVPLTAAGLPRKKPGRKPGTIVKPKENSATAEPKQRRPRKPRDPNAPPIQRKRKAAAVESVDGAMELDPKPPVSEPAVRQTKITELASMRPVPEPRTVSSSEPMFTKAIKHESIPGSMKNILNDDPPPKPQPPVPAPSRPIFDPVRGNYDPVRETMISRDPYGTGPLGSPRAPTQVTNRASASPSIASLVDPPTNIISPVPSHTSFNTGAAVQSGRFQESGSLPPSPSQAVRSVVQQAAKPATAEIQRPPRPPPVPATTKAEPPKSNSFTSMSTIPSGAAIAATAAAPAPVQSKKVAAVVQQERDAQKKTSSTSSSPKITSAKDSLPALPEDSERSILDFGKARPGDESATADIVLHIPLNGETNKYVNFMRMAEERFGWDALHPRQAANRDRKARIAAASAALEKNGSGRESGDDMSVDAESDGEGSNVEMGGMGNTASGPDGAPAKPARKKRNFKEDEYDKDDDFVDDSELLWEAQAAASQDGFFVYSGPLIPEVEKPAATEGPTKRGRGGRGSRGGARAATARGEGTGRGRGGGPGSRGGSVTRKPRITKLEREQRDREKAEREKLVQMTSKTGSTNNTHNILGSGTTPSIAEGIAS